MTANLPVNVQSTLSFEVSETVLESLSDEYLSPLDLYEIILKDLKARAATSDFLADTYRRKCASLQTEKALAEESLSSATMMLEKLQAEFQQASIGDPKQVAILTRQLNEELLTKQQQQQRILGLESELTQLQASYAMVEKDHKALQEKLAALEASYASDKALYENRLLVADGKLTDFQNTSVKTMERELAAVKKKLETSERAVEVLNRDNKKLIQARKEGNQQKLDSLQALRTAKSKLDAMSAELAKTRIDNFYLEALHDCYLNTDLLKYPDGSVCLYSLQTNEIESDEYPIDPAYPIGMWLGKNGFSCVLAVSQYEDQDGNRDLIMPMIKDIPEDILHSLTPRREYHQEIINRLMQYSVVVCNARLAQLREELAPIAKQMNHFNNQKIANKDLIAVSRDYFAGKTTVVPKRTTASKKRGHK